MAERARAKSAGAGATRPSRGDRRGCGREEGATERGRIPNRRLSSCTSAGPGSRKRRPTRASGASPAERTEPGSPALSDGRGRSCGRRMRKWAETFSSATRPIGIAAASRTRRSASIRAARGHTCGTVSARLRGEDLTGALTARPLALSELPARRGSRCTRNSKSSRPTRSRRAACRRGASPP